MKQWGLALLCLAVLSGCTTKNSAIGTKIGDSDQFIVRVDAPGSGPQHFEILVGGEVAVQSYPAERVYRIGSGKVATLTRYIADHFAQDTNVIDECLKGGRDPQEHVFMIWISFQTKTGKQGTFSIIRRGGFTKSDLDSVRAVLALIDAQVGFPDGGATRILDQWLPMTSTTVPPSHTSP